MSYSSPPPNDSEPPYPPPGYDSRPRYADSPNWVSVKTPEEQPVVTYVLLGLTILIFVLQAGSEMLLGVDWPAQWGVKFNDWIIQGQIWRLLTPMLLHRSILHLGFNMYALYALGRGLERFYGHKRYLALYILSGFAGNVISFIFSENPSLGASTAIFGLLGAEGVFLYINRQILGASARTALTNVITIAVINLIIGFSPGIDNWGHVGGLVGGTLFAWFGGPVLQLVPGYPHYTLRDQRDSNDALRAGIGVGLLFAFLAAIKIFF